MLSEIDKKSLLDLFMNSGNNINLTHLLDLINTKIPDQQSQEWQVWTKHMDKLNKAWVQIMKEGMNMPWPGVWDFNCSSHKGYRAYLWNSHQ
jgi:hypothetical protein